MRQYIRKYVAVLSAVAAVFSCSGPLDLEPVSSISNASFWKTENDANGVLFAMYQRLRLQYEGNFNMMFWGEGRSEALGNNFGANENSIFWDNQLSKSNPGPTWTGLYTIIHHANLILKYVPGIAFTSEANKNNLLAQAYTMRAFLYYTMVKTWGDVILLTEPTEGFTPESVQKERTVKEKVFEQIKQDLDNAINLFPNNNFQAGRFLWSLPAALTLKADVYLWTGKRLNGGNADFTVALDALNKAENSDIALLSDFASVFEYGNKGNKEILMAIRFQQFESSENWGRVTYMNPGQIRPDFDEETTEAIGTTGTDGGRFSISEITRAQFTEEDQRKKATFYEVYTTDTAGNRQFYTAFCTKFKGFVNGGVRVYFDDMVVYRYADLLLLKAEAKNALGQDPSAEINKIRERAYGSNSPNHVFVAGSKEQNDEAILKERLLEFTLEGKRWWDLVRFGKAFDLVPSLQNRKEQDHLLLFPISESTLSLEHKVKQNPGYE